MALCTRDFSSGIETNHYMKRGERISSAHSQSLSLAFPHILTLLFLEHTKTPVTIITVLTSSREARAISTRTKLKLYCGKCMHDGSLWRLHDDAGRHITKLKSRIHTVYMHDKGYCTQVHYSIWLRMFTCNNFCVTRANLLTMTHNALCR